MTIPSSSITSISFSGAKVQHPSAEHLASMAPDTSGPLPRILCLHGGGTSAKIFNIQTVRLQRKLRNQFRFVFVNGPFLSDPGPGVSPFFDELGPFYRWVRKEPSETGEQITEAVESGLRGKGKGVEMGMGHRDDETAGPVVGVLGFSQGGGVAAGLLDQQQRQNAAGEKGYGLRFGVFCMGAYPPWPPSKGPASEPEVAHGNFDPAWEGRIKIPSLVLHGLQDPFIDRISLLYRCFDTQSSKLIEKDLEHRLPTDDSDNDELAQAILELYEKTRE